MPEKLRVLLLVEQLRRTSPWSDDFFGIRIVALIRDVTNHMVAGYLLIAKAGRAADEPEGALLLVLLHLPHQALHLTPLSLKLASVLNVFNDGLGQEGDVPVHPGSAHRTV